jgi:dynein heavy chain 2
MWSNFSRSNECEKEFPSAIEKKTSLFQQLLVVQAIRPDRLQTAMGLFACKALGKM